MPLPAAGSAPRAAAAGPRRTAPYLGWEEPPTLAPRASAGGGEEARARRPAGERPAEPGAAAGAPPGEGTAPPRLALRGAAGGGGSRRRAPCAEMSRGPDPAAAKVGEGRLGPL